MKYIFLKLTIISSENVDIDYLNNLILSNYNDTLFYEDKIMYKNQVLGKICHIKSSVYPQKLI